MLSSGKGPATSRHKLPQPGSWITWLAARGGHAWQRALERPALWLLVWLVLGTWVLLPQDPLSRFEPEEVTVGAIAERDYVAPVDAQLEDFAATERERERVRREVLPVWDFDSAAAALAELRFAALFDAGRRLARERPDLSVAERLETLQAESELTLSAAAVALLHQEEWSPALEDRVRSTLATLLQAGIVADKEQLLQQRLAGVSQRDLATGDERLHFDFSSHLDYPQGVRSTLTSEVRRWPSFAARSKRTTMVELLLSNLTPNLRPNPAATQERRQRVAQAVRPVLVSVREGQMIVRRGDKIDAQAARVINGLAPANSPLSWLLRQLGCGLVALLAALVLWLGLKRERVAHHSREKLFDEALLLLLLSVLGTRLGFVIAGALAEAADIAAGTLAGYGYAIPFASLAATAYLLLGRQVALVLALVYALLCGLLVPSDGHWWSLYSMGGALAAIFALDGTSFKQRLVTVRVAAVVALANATLILILTALHSGLEVSPAQVGFDLLGGLAGGLLVAAVVSPSVPLFEALLGVTTDIKLVELANTNLPLLRRLAFEAPGTFQHSLMVANLAKEGCDAIGADSVLAYTGALYHDVGKTLRPEYFVENQRPGRNRHDKLLPSMSALILVKHVKDGLELARQHHLPQPVCDAISQHHGTRLIKFFYNKAIDLCSRQGEEVHEEEYRYPGPKPQDRVMAVLMLADSVEAASRTLNEPTTAKIRALVQKIIDDCLQDEQLDQCDLTFSDLSKVADAFQRVLANIYHRRIDYPGFSFNAEPVRPAEPSEAAGTAAAATS